MLTAADRWRFGRDRGGAPWCFQRPSRSRPGTATAVSTRDVYVIGSFSMVWQMSMVHGDSGAGSVAPRSVGRNRPCGAASAVRLYMTGLAAGLERTDGWTSGREAGWSGSDATSVSDGVPPSRGVAGAAWSDLVRRCCSPCSSQGAGRQVWNRAGTDEVLIDAALSHEKRHSLERLQQVVWSRVESHTPLISREPHERAQQDALRACSICSGRRTARTELRFTPGSVCR